MAKKTATTKPENEEAQPSKIQRFARYVEDSKAELRKVSWPSVQETKKATLAVLGFCAVMAILLGLVDLGLSSIIKSFLS